MKAFQKTAILVTLLGLFMNSQAQIVREKRIPELTPNSRAMGFVTFEGVKQGRLKGDGPEHLSRTEFLGYSFSLSQAYDPTTSLIYGKTKQGTVKILKKNGPSTPQIIDALANNEELKSVLLEFIRPQTDGSSFVYYTVKMTKARIIKIEQSTDDGNLNLKQGALPIDEITLVYQRIEFEQKDGGTKSMVDSENN